MVHNLIDLVVAGVKGTCAVHGTDSRQCGAAKEIGGYAIGALVVGGVVAALKS